MMTRKSNIWLPFWVGVIFLLLIGAWVAACSVFLLNSGSNDLVLIPSPTPVTLPAITPSPILTPTLAPAATATLVKATLIPAPAGIASTTFVPPPPTAPPVITAWRGEYFGNPGLAGTPALVRDDPSVIFDWGTGAPGPGLPSESFSARWTRSLWFGEGLYRLYVRADDGVRLWVDGQLIVD
ncbi:MAG TPA: PA14 domain-containing protein, partial [Anaerolineae bacterium]